ncbi:MAG: thiosulfate/3-mercaptopyruvate sulfurtransferase [Kiritimatiellia bacterium]|jgi:thiosulfate/3-mercaptopyruvate sulfurtransferase
MTVYIDARKRRPTSWVPGAHWADLESDLSNPGDPAVGGRHPLPSLTAWCRTVGRWGIGPDTDVVVYDDKNGGLAAARVWWMLQAVGHTSVSVCTLLELSMELTTSASNTVDVGVYPAQRWHWPMVDGDVVDVRRSDPTWRVIDARSHVRFVGEYEVIDPVAGHIPGAHNLPWEETIELAQAEERLSAILGEVPMDRVIVHCGSGVTACHTLLQMHRLGLARAAMYVGSWSEWCRDETRELSPDR